MVPNHQNLEACPVFVSPAPRDVELDRQTAAVLLEETLQVNRRGVAMVAAQQTPSVG